MHCTNWEKRDIVENSLCQKPKNEVGRIESFRQEIFSKTRKNRIILVEHLMENFCRGKFCRKIVSDKVIFDEVNFRNSGAKISLPSRLSRNNFWCLQTIFDKKYGSIYRLR